MGVNLVAITPESIENVEQTVKLHTLTYTVIYDCQEQIMKDFDVMFNVTKAYQDLVSSYLSIDIAKNNGREAARLPVPATYIINRDGIIVAVQFDPDYNNRATVKWVIKNLSPRIIDFQPSGLITSSWSRISRSPQVTCLWFQV